MTIVPTVTFTGSTDSAEAALTTEFHLQPFYDSGFYPEPWRINIQIETEEGEEFHSLFCKDYVELITETSNLIRKHYEKIDLIWKPTKFNSRVFD